MIRKRSIKLMTVLGVLVVAASFSRPPRAVRAAGEAPSGRVITRLVGQHRAITISSTSNGVRYSVDVDGKTILANATLDELRLRHPESFRQIQSSIAHSSPQSWAGVDMIDADR
ncbi:MAG: hypothetical protein H7Z14_12475 [Anaerolineae bacterium]|nr:hypothetical protein [Phycisphaerae bacterium]